MKTGYCYDTNFEINIDYPNINCSKYGNLQTINENLFSFERNSWSWHPQTLISQKYHYNQVTLMNHTFNKTQLNELWKF